jgi:hypothetical protein
MMALSHVLAGLNFAWACAKAFVLGTATGGKAGGGYSSFGQRAAVPPGQSYYEDETNPEGEDCFEPRTAALLVFTVSAKKSAKVLEKCWGG